MINDDVQKLDDLFSWDEDDDVALEANFQEGDNKHFDEEEGVSKKEDKNTFEKNKDSVLDNLEKKKDEEPSVEIDKNTEGGGFDNLENNKIDNNNIDNSDNVVVDNNTFDINKLTDIKEKGDEKNKLKISSKEKERELDEKIDEIDLDRKELEIENQARQKGLGYINLRGLPIIMDSLRIIEEVEAKENNVVCFFYKKKQEIRIAFVEFGDNVLEIAERLKKENNVPKVGLYLTSQPSIKTALKQYDHLPKIINKEDEVTILERDVESQTKDVQKLQDVQEKIKTANMTEVFSIILAAAVAVDASDIHIEAEENGIQVRYRIDGVLHDIAKIDNEMWKKLISRIKLSSKLKLNIQDKPQDGRFSAHFAGKSLDFRVSTIPTAYGESVVMRILYHDKVKKMKLDTLGLGESHRQIIEKEIQKPNGMLIVTGPTGSGKTTTLYAVLNKINTPETKIITVEDPIEYKIEGINQSEVNDSRGYTFSQALRSVVRQDPDVVLVGEIRDSETVDIALNASLTGHLVFSTIHTNDASGVVPRMISLGAKPYIISPALNAVIAQRLVRKVCEHCKEEYNLTDEERSLVNKEIQEMPEFARREVGENMKFVKGKGCDVCSGLGYKGQIGIFEILLVTERIKELILEENISEHKIKEEAKKNNMLTMVGDGLVKASKGITSLEEVMRVT